MRRVLGRCAFPGHWPAADACGSRAGLRRAAIVIRPREAARCRRSGNGFNRVKTLLYHITFGVGLLAAASVLALLEIEIEGREGWAGRLPTWRLTNAWTRRLLGARSLTGYHVYVHLFVLILAHLPYLLGLIRPSITAELRILAFLLLLWTLEDFLWFVLNPAYGIRRFRREEIWWHAPTWWWIMPRDYWIFVPLGVALYILSWMA